MTDLPRTRFRLPYQHPVHNLVRCRESCLRNGRWLAGPSNLPPGCGAPQKPPLAGSQTGSSVHHGAAYETAATHRGSCSWAATETPNLCAVGSIPTAPASRVKPCAPAGNLVRARPLPGEPRTGSGRVQFPLLSTKGSRHTPGVKRFAPLKALTNRDPGPVARSKRASPPARLSLGPGPKTPERR